MGSQWFGQIRKWRVGDYVVVSSKLGSTYIDTKANLPKTKSDSTSTTRFSFVMTDNTTDSATVTTAYRFASQSTHELKLSKTVSLGRDELVQESDTFTAVITINADTTKTWTLFKRAASDASDGVFEAYLSNGERRIELVPVIATQDGGKSFFSQLTSQAVPPALGYEFVEDDRSLCVWRVVEGPGAYRVDAQGPPCERTAGTRCRHHRDPANGKFAGWNRE